jgi:hypothetical protein
MSTLSAERCVACRRDSPRVTEAEIADLRREVFSDWQLLERDGIRVFLEHERGSLLSCSASGSLARHRRTSHASTAAV